MQPKNLILLLGLCLSTGIQAVEYVKISPMSSLVKSTVGNVQASEVTTIPIITWGGDIATLHGNGDTTVTHESSILAKLGVKNRLIRQDIFSKQIESYLAGTTPYLRGTLGMINQASDVLNKDPRTKPVIIYQSTWSAGGDALVVKSGIKNAKDLKGKTIVLQAYGPHVDYMMRVLTDAGLSAKDVNIRWVKDLTGTDNAPMEAFRQNDVDAAFVIIPDALALTSGGSIGTGSEDSIKGASVLISTKTANRIIADVYAVRSDYFKAHRNKVEAFVSGLMKSTEAMQAIVKNKTQKATEYKKMMSASAKALLDSEKAIADTEGMYADAKFVGFDGNVQFFSNANYPRRMAVLNQEIQQGLAQLGLVKGTVRFESAQWDYGLLQTGLSNTNQQQGSIFNASKVATVLNQRQKQGVLNQGELFKFEIYFSPNQKSFSADLYQNAFDKVINLASTYGGAVITVEGHSDPMGYLRKHKAGEQALVLGQIKQSAKNLSLGRSQAVRDTIIKYATAKGIALDASQFAIIGHGISAPKSGVCGTLPCAPKTEKDWRANMRVEFRIIQIEAEDSVFQPL
ncbi:MAG: ABC transporter substrate-binding protein [Methylococcales bacterium]|nr:ABC transporter substrate-binding protein [Methylococcales bacterium]